MHKQARGLGDDPLSAASAGLFALRVPRARRTSTLDLLGAMLDLADRAGHVEVDRPLYEVEQLVGMNDALESYSWLERLGVLVRTSSGWQIQNFAEHRGPIGATAASMDVLRRHLDSVGEPEGVVVPLRAAPTAEPSVAESLAPGQIKRWRRAVPLAAAGIAASVVAVTGASQFLPQAASNTRDAALHASAPTSVVNEAASKPGAAVSEVVKGVPAATTVVTSPAAIAGAPIAGSLIEGVACLAPRVLTAVTSLELVRLPLAGDRGQSLWAAVVSGTATLTDSTTPILLPALSVIAHVIDGDTDPVLATLGAPLLLPNIAVPFTAVITLGETKPDKAVTASAAAAGLNTCP